jgi:hypothetical protein
MSIIVMLSESLALSEVEWVESILHYFLGDVAQRRIVRDSSTSFRYAALRSE